MTRWCVVPKCKTGRRGESKRSVFRVPKDFVQLKKWEAVIPGIVELKPIHVVCENHFEEKYIRREWIKHDADGRIIARVPYKYPQLDKLAIPSKFGDIMPIKEFMDAVYEEDSIFLDPATDVVTKVKDAVSQDPLDSTGSSSFKYHVSAKDNLTDSSNECIQSRDSHPVITSIQRIGTCLEDSSDMKNIPKVELPIFIETSLSLTKEVCSNPPGKVTCKDKPIIYANAVVARAKPCMEYSSVVVREDTKGVSSSMYEELLGTVPEPWSMAKFPADEGQSILFSFAIRKRENGIDCPVTQKSVIVNADRTIRYYIYGRPINPQNTILDNTFRTNESFPNILKIFQNMNICGGLGVVNIHHLPVDGAFQDYVGQWCSKNCSLVSKKRRCESCAKTRKCARQKMSRLLNRSTLMRIHNVSNLVDQCKLLAMRKKHSHERRQKYRAIKQAEHLKYCLQTQREEIFNLKQATLDETCSQLNVTASQKTFRHPKKHREVILILGKKI